MKLCNQGTKETEQIRQPFGSPQIASMRDFSRMGDPYQEEATLNFSRHSL